MTATRNQRLEQITALLCENPRTWFSRAEIARHLGIKKTPYLAALLDELYQDNVLTEESGTMYNGLRVLLYRYFINNGCTNE